VEGHMHVCLQVDSNCESMVTTSASEPLLSEAAYSRMMLPSFNAPKALMSILRGFPIDRGRRAEFLVMLLFTIARDKFVGPPAESSRPAKSRIIDVATLLTNELFRYFPKSKELLADFPNAKMHFNHYVRIHEHVLINSESLLLLSTRGAGVLCATGQHFIDGINPFLCNGTTLSHGNLSLILWQSKNKLAFTDEPQQKLFDYMDVYSLKILEKNDAAIPLIKIIFALAAEKPCLRVNRRSPSSGYNAVIYEVWCAGLTRETFNAIYLTDGRIWPALLRASYGREADEDEDWPTDRAQVLLQRIYTSRWFKKPSTRCMLRRK
jgi:hypothetical protein